MYSDKVLVCKDCGQEFTFTAGEQEFYAEKGFTNEPQRCKACRANRKSARNDAAGTRQMFDTVCSECGNPCKVPPRSLPALFSSLCPNEGGAFCARCGSGWRGVAVGQNRLTLLQNLGIMQASKRGENPHRAREGGHYEIYQP